METSSTCYNIRVAQQSDLDQIVELALSAAKESPIFSKVDVHKELVTNSISYYIDTEVTVVVELKGSIIGFIIAEKGQLWYSLNIVVNELLFYIAPEYRGSNISIKLVKYFIENAKLFNPSKITMGGSLHPEYFNKLECFYKRLGFELEGFTMRLGE